MKLTDIFMICLVLLTYNYRIQIQKRDYGMCSSILYLQIIAIYVLSVSE